eukprot:CAMPEP_0204259140 /NCGR_PEP_ID=MMETSP0468-20130131/5419_1 /ASSEMBLY_ACC=CAM_ASM_000383 /TAXON_ID=2969 /ORGANISM="Oxyrrhis marina" /LENGTH=51 /DNA_ID=CAMNT_0051233387 /DNA_START=47 /DNA_END=202 /DNA_ORIENTATION=-
MFDGLPDPLDKIVPVLLGLHLLAFICWALTFVKHMVAPPLHPIQEEQKKTK